MYNLAPFISETAGEVHSTVFIPAETLNPLQHGFSLILLLDTGLFVLD